MKPNRNQSDKRRMFINKDETIYQVLSFSQHKDGSIYCSMPEFINTRWLSFRLSKDGKTPEMVGVDSPPEDGKFSMHGSGMLTFRTHKDHHGHTLIIKGHPLLSIEKGKIGIRHLFTYFPTEPKCLPVSPAYNRESDYVLKKTGELRPFAMTFFAIPSKENLAVKFEISFLANDIEAMPPDVAFGNFALSHHNIVWVYYRTKYMDNWPEQTHIWYFDGHAVPILIGTDQGTGRIELRNPSYKLDDHEVQIKI